jgi:hypothetical protein
MDSWKWGCTHEDCEAVGGEGTYDECETAAAAHVEDREHAVTYIWTLTNEPSLKDCVISGIHDAFEAILPTLMPTATPDEIAATADTATQAASAQILLQEG